jgi:hypothetical protein
MSKRGRKARPCPNPALLAELAGSPPETIAKRLGCSRKAVVRWLGEIGVSVPPPQPMDDVLKRGWTTLATSAFSGRRLGSKLYWAWDNMKKRCYGTLPRFRESYAGRGIVVCDEWRESYATFRRWSLENGFAKGLTLDRIDNDGSYLPSNCRWTTRAQQQQNTRATIHMTLRGITRPLPAWSRELNISMYVLRARLSQGWTDEQALTIPIGQRRPAEFRKRPGRKPQSIHC